MNQQTSQPKPKIKLVSHILNIVTIVLIVECFLCAMMAVRQYARNNCLERIEETNAQAAQVFMHAMDERTDKLTVFADLLSANFTMNGEHAEPLLQEYMENFCKTQYFSAVCIHRADGTVSSYGDHPHHSDDDYSFEVEKRQLPYTSDVIAKSGTETPLRAEQFIYQAVKIDYEGEAVAILYGYTSLDTLASMVYSSAYDGKCEFYVVDGDTGCFLINDYHRYNEDGSELPLGSIDSLGQRETKLGYDIETMKADIQNGRSGEFIFKSQKTDEWYYTYYAPLLLDGEPFAGKNWSMQLTIDEPTAFAAYTSVNNAMILLMVCVVVLMLIHVLALMLQNAHSNRVDRERLRRSSYINAVQRALLDAHNNPDFVGRALKIIADEMQAETVLLLSFSGHIVTNAQYWPSKDKAQAMNLMGLNIRDDFPMLFDAISVNNSVVYNEEETSVDISATAKAIFKNLEVSNMVLVPVTDTAGALKGAIAAVNIKGHRDPSILECVTYDFFMAITNLENHNIIKNMGAMDYLTGIKNRNSYEAALKDYAIMDDCTTLWCVFVDVNNLHEVNNTQGHKAGDIMLCAVANAVKRIFGERDSYRVGGDEFVAFATDSTTEEFLKKKRAIMAELAAKGYHVSVGFESIERTADGIFDIERVVTAAEAIMYREKRKYYATNDISPERGHFPDVHTDSDEGSDC